MNRRLPRIALLVVLLVSMFGLFTLGDISPVGTSVAQELEDPCPTPPATPAPMGSELVDTQTIDLSTATDVNVQEVTLAAGETVSVRADPNALMAVESGSVTLTVCADDTVAVMTEPVGTIELVEGPATRQLDPVDTVYATSSVVYYLTGVDPASRLILTVIVTGGGASCGGAGC